MKKRLKQLYNNSTLTTKIRYSYFLLLLPVVIFSIFCFYNLWVVNRNYEAMLNSTVIASEFSLDFKKDFDYETYLLIVENKSIEESNLDDILSEANRVVNGLEEFTNSEDNEDRLNDVKKYLKNLESYKERIEENLQEGNKYEDNMEIWENDVQIVTSLLRETIFQYIYYEISQLQELRAEYRNVFMLTAWMLVAAFACILAVIILSLIHI